MSIRCQETQINGPMRTLSSLITNFERGNSAHLCSYDIYAVTVLAMYTESSVNEGNTTPPRNSSVLNVVILECTAVICCDSHTTACNIKL
jgi:hypothetical protein